MEKVKNAINVLNKEIEKLRSFAQENQDTDLWYSTNNYNHALKALEYDIAVMHEYEKQMNCK